MDDPVSSEPPHSWAGGNPSSERVMRVVFTTIPGSSMGRMVKPFRATRQALVRFKKAIPSCLATRYAASSAVVKY
jgi:hypothetical protein